MRLIITAITFLLLIACATPYQSGGFMGGFNEVQLAEDSYQVSFGGNGYTSTQRAIDFTLLRCADIAIRKRIQILCRSWCRNRTKTSVQSNPGSLNVAPSINTVSKPSSATNTITLINERIQGQFAYEAGNHPQKASEININSHMTLINENAFQNVQELVRNSLLQLL